jgi:protein-tyrosine phosphatase
MAEAMLRGRLTELGLTDHHVHSAGLLYDGRSATTDGVEVLRSRGLDLSSHSSRRMTKELLTDADLVLGMTREHVREAAVLLPEAWPRTFTLKELVRRGLDAGPREPSEPLNNWLRRIASDRKLGDVVGDSPVDDIADPIGKPREAYERTANEIDELLRRLVALLWGQERDATGSSR